MMMSQEDPLWPHPAVLKSVEPDTPGVATFRLEFQDRERQERYRLQPGQFNMIYVAGVGEVPISVSSTSDEGPGIGHTIRFVGRVTNVIGKLQPGAVLGLRGPYGRGWPIEQAVGRDVLLVAGGLGLAPLRLVVRALLADRHRFGRLTLLYGARQPADLLYTAEYPEWQRQGMEVMITVDRANQAWHGRVGVVPQLFGRLRVDPERTIVLTCGPEILMRYTVDEALHRRVSDRDIFYSIERNMQCAVGLCGHCQLGPAFICKNGPVFSHRDIAPFFGQEQL
jgi:NAD(P)H-flavin reductase